jgi:hypothetical protein
VNLYELAWQTTATANAAPIFELIASGRPLSLLELVIRNNAATAQAQGQLGRPGNTPAGGTAQTATLPINVPQDGVASGGGVILSGWTTAPTQPAAGNRHRISGMPASIGAGETWSWLPGEMIVGTTRSRSLVYWNASGAVIGLLNCYAKFVE